MNTEDTEVNEKSGDKETCEEICDIQENRVVEQTTVKDSETVTEGQLPQSDSTILETENPNEINSSSDNVEEKSDLDVSITKDSAEKTPNVDVLYPASGVSVSHDDSLLSTNGQCGEEEENIIHLSSNDVNPSVKPEVSLLKENETENVLSCDKAHSDEASDNCGDEISNNEINATQEEEESPVLETSIGSDFDADQVRNYGTSILAIAESSRATRLHERFQSGRAGMKGKKSDASIDSASLSASSEEQDRHPTSTIISAKDGTPMTPQISEQSQSTSEEKSATTAESIVPLQPATIRRDGLAVEPEGSKENGINHYKITLSKEMQEAIQREKCRLESEEIRQGIIGRVSKGVGSYLAQRRERRERLELERKISEANRALQEMRRASDSFVSEEDSDEEIHVEVEPEPPTKFRPVAAILTKPLIATFAKSYLPASVGLLKWKRIYSLSRDGDSFHTFLANVERWQKTLLVVRTNREDLFGAYCDDAWGGQKNEMETAAFYGSGQSFLFKISTAKSEDVSFAPHQHDSDAEQIVVYKWTGANRYVQLCDPSKKLIAMGGGGLTGSFGLCLEDDFSVGSSGHCDTFGNEPLSSQEHFDVLDFEVWGFTSGSGLNTVTVPGAPK